MVKRTRDDTPGPERHPKRVKPSSGDHLSRLSDELILRVLSHVPVSQLAVCQRLSHKYQALAGDNQLWKALYYDRFVRPRASRLPGLRDGEGSGQRLTFTSKTSKWLEDEHLVGRGAKTNWKRQYKLRHNWTRGSCAVDEIEVAERAAVPPILVQMHDGIIYTADQTDGLRAWSTKGERKIMAHIAFSATASSSSSSPPTSLAIDSQPMDGSGRRLAVGYEDGSFSIYMLDYSASRFNHLFSHEPSVNGVISSSSMSWPYVATMTATQLLSLYRFKHATDDAQTGGGLDPPRLLHSLKSHTVWPPLSTSLRSTTSHIMISIAYALPTYLSGWTVGIQEIQVSLKGDLLNSRLASAIDQHYRPLAFAAPPMMHYLNSPGARSHATSTMETRHIHSKPTSLSYTHPYLLVSHPDNTLTLYLVTSTTDSLSISAGSRLWGHTSSVSGAHVGGRGKAVSVSARGDELRVWELEGGFTSSAARKRLANGDLSVRIQPESQKSSTTQAGLDLVNQALAARAHSACSTEQHRQESSELTLTRGWIGFDEENVVVLKEQSQGRQALVVYDFT